MSIQRKYRLNKRRKEIGMKRKEKKNYELANL